MVEILARGSIRSGGSGQVSSSVRRKLNCVHAVFFGESRHSGAIDGDAIEMALKDRLLCGGEINHALGFVYSRNAADFPITGGELRELFASESVKIKMAIAGALAGP